MKDLTPRQIVAALDRHIIGQDAAKRAVAVAVRNRWRRQQLDPELAREVAPKNIVMIGPTCPTSSTPRSSRSRRPSTPRWATTAGMSSPWSATCWSWA